MTESFAELFEQSIASQRIRPGTILNGLIVEVGQDYVIVNVGLKSEAVIPSDQFRNEKGEIEVAVGETVEVALDSIEDGSGETRLSREKAKRARTWTRLENGFREARNRHRHHHRPGQGRLHGRNRQCPRVPARLAGRCASGARSVVPRRQGARIQGHQARPEAQQRGRVAPRGRRAGIQRRAFERCSTICRKARWSRVSSRTSPTTARSWTWAASTACCTSPTWRGSASSIRPKWSRSAKKSKCAILKFDRERQRVSLGLKQLGEDPWQNIARRYPANTRLFGKVTNIADYGCFVEIEEGVEGLVHVSEMDWTNKNVNPAKVVHVGQEVEVMVLDIDEERRRISLGMKQCKTNPWKEFAENYNRGDKVSGQIKSITDFGIFIGLDGGIDGLVHLSDISWDMPGEEAVRNYQKGAAG